MTIDELLNEHLRAIREGDEDSILKRLAGDEEASYEMRIKFEEACEDWGLDIRVASSAIIATRIFNTTCDRLAKVV